MLAPEVHESNLRRRRSESSKTPATTKPTVPVTAKTKAPVATKPTVPVTAKPKTPVAASSKTTVATSSKTLVATKPKTPRPAVRVVEPRDVKPDPGMFFFRISGLPPIGFNSRVEKLDFSTWAKTEPRLRRRSTLAEFIKMFLTNLLRKIQLL